MLREERADVSFTIPGSRIRLTAMPGSSLACPWDIELEDKNFDKEVSLPRHALAREACYVVFHSGEPETALSQTRCRTPLRDSAREVGENK